MFQDLSPRLEASASKIKSIKKYLDGSGLSLEEKRILFRECLASAEEPFFLERDSVLEGILSEALLGAEGALFLRAFDSLIERLSPDVLSALWFKILKEAQKTMAALLEKSLLSGGERSIIIQARQNFREQYLNYQHGRLAKELQGRRLRDKNHFVRQYILDMRESIEALMGVSESQPLINLSSLALYGVDLRGLDLRDVSFENSLVKGLQVDAVCVEIRHFLNAEGFSQIEGLSSEQLLVLQAKKTETLLQLSDRVSGSLKAEENNRSSAFESDLKYSTNREDFPTDGGDLMNVTRQVHWMVDETLVGYQLAERMHDVQESLETLVPQTIQMTTNISDAPTTSLMRLPIFGGRQHAPTLRDRAELEEDLIAFQIEERAKFGV